MKRKFTATVWREGDWHIAQCIEVDVISQGETEQEAVKNLAEAIQLYFESPTAASTAPKLMTVEVEIDAA
ncbi:MAG TPA: type II toxin-antitoxin system HicB family antitoxin [Candidatus Obscuribacterales bacterium]